MESQDEEIILDEIKKNPNVKLEEFIIISHFFEEDNEEEENKNKINSKEIFLPTPESLKILCDKKFVKDFIKFDLDKYKSNFKENLKNNKELNKKILNLDNISFINTSKISSYLLIFLGGINSMNTIYDFFDESVILPEEKCYIDHNISYIDYLNNIMDYLKKEEQNNNIYFNFCDLESILKSLDAFGINIPRNNSNIIYRHIKDSVFSMENNKILVLIAPSNNFWMKNDNKSIGNKIYDRQLNHKTNLFYNDKFIKKFYDNVVKHHRCKIGLICSMNKNNLKNSYDGMNIIINDKNNENILIDQEYHDPDDKTYFKRSMKKIIQFLKFNKYNYFDEKNIIIIESKKEKIGNDTKNNSIIVNLFNEEYIQLDKKMRENKEDEVINYILDLLEKCEGDVREYIKKIKINNLIE